MDGDGLQWVCVDELHENRVPRLVDRAWDGEAVFVEDLVRGRKVGIVSSGTGGDDRREYLHEGPLLLGGETGHVHPGGGFALAHVVSFFFDSAERYSSQSSSIV